MARAAAPWGTSTSGVLERVVDVEAGVDGAERRHERALAAEAVAGDGVPGVEGDDGDVAEAALAGAAVVEDVPVLGQHADGAVLLRVVRRLVEGGEERGAADPAGLAVGGGRAAERVGAAGEVVDRVEDVAQVGGGAEAGLAERADGGAGGEDAVDDGPGGDGGEALAAPHGLLAGLFGAADDVAVHGPAAAAGGVGLFEQDEVVFGAALFDEVAEVEADAAGFGADERDEAAAERGDDVVVDEVGGGAGEGGEALVEAEQERAHVAVERGDAGFGPADEAVEERDVLGAPAPAGDAGAGEAAEALDEGLAVGGGAGEVEADLEPGERLDGGGVGVFAGGAERGDDVVEALEHGVDDGVAVPAAVDGLLEPLAGGGAAGVEVEHERCEVEAEAERAAVAFVEAGERGAEAEALRGEGHGAEVEEGERDVAGRAVERGLGAGVGGGVGAVRHAPPQRELAGEVDGGAVEALERGGAAGGGLAHAAELAGLDAGGVERGAGEVDAVFAGEVGEVGEAGVEQPGGAVGGQVDDGVERDRGRVALDEGAGLGLDPDRADRGRVAGERAAVEALAEEVGDGVAQGGVAFEVVDAGEVAGVGMVAGQAGLVLVEEPGQHGEHAALVGFEALEDAREAEAVEGEVAAELVADEALAAAVAAGEVAGGGGDLAKVRLGEALAFGEADPVVGVALVERFFGHGQRSEIDLGSGPPGRGGPEGAPWRSTGYLTG